MENKYIHTYIHTCVVLAVLSFTQTACDESADSADQRSSAVSALSDSNVSVSTSVSEKMVADTEEVVGENENFFGDSPLPIIKLEWNNGDTNDNARTAEVLSLKVKNYEQMPAEIFVRIEFAGILEETASFDAGSYAVEPFGEISITLPADKIPMQTMVGVCQAVASLDAVFRDGEKEYNFRTGSAPIFYRQQDGYQKTVVFGPRIFAKEYRGRFTDLSGTIKKHGAEAAQNAVLGRINRDGKGPVDVSVRSSRAAKREVDDVSFIVSTGWGSVGSHEDEEREMGYVK